MEIKMKTKFLIGLLVMIVLLSGCAREKGDIDQIPESVSQKMCEGASWPPEGNCSIIPEIQGKEFCEKCKELMGEEKFMSMMKKKMKIIELEPADLTQLTFLDHASDPDWSPDGSQIVFEGREGEKIGIYLINTDGTGLTKIGSDHNPSWSPVDNRILLRDNCQGGCSLILLDLDKGWENKVELASQINEQGSWSPDGKKVAYSSSSGSIWVMNSDGSEKTRLTTDEDGFSMAPSFSYDGSKIVYLKGFTSYAIGGGGEKMEPNEIWAMNSDGSNKHKVYAPGDSTQLIFQRAWNKDDKILFMRTWYRENKYPQTWVMNYDGSNPKLLVSGDNAFGDPVWDNTGTKVAISKTPPLATMGSNLWLFPYQEPKNIFQKIWEKILGFIK